MSALADAVETVEIWVDMWADEQAEIEDASPCDHEERKVIEAVRKLLKAIKGKGTIPDPEEGHRFCSHKVAEDYWDGQMWMPLGQYQRSADWYRRRIPAVKH
jgi:hypothetical protein